LRVLWFWIFVGPALFLAALALRGERKRAEFVTSRLAELDELPPRPLPLVTLIVPVTGSCGSLRESLLSLASQNYPDYELIIVVPNAGYLPPGVLPPVAKVALAGETGRSALLRAGIQLARRRSTVFAFAASGALVSELWLRALVEPLSEENVGMSTGFRWYAPDPPTFWSLMQSVWNALIAARLGAGSNDFAWAGAMAIDKELFFQERVPESWTGAMREDFALSRIVLNSGRRIAFAPGAMAACTSRATAGQFLRQARREMEQARRYLPRLWWSGLLAHVVYCGAMVVAIIASARGNRGAEWVLVIQFGLGMLKGANRATLAKAELPEQQTWFDRYSWTQTFWVPLATWVWLYVLVVSAFVSE
jgi:cellulose synthase/poly-beta-1,6-N-acetylglucosamine synthase-like glycosyltransferase